MKHIIDCHGIFGRLGFAAPGEWRAEAFLAELDKHGITQSVISTTTAMLHDVDRGNKELFELCKKHNDRLLPLPVANPRWGWSEAEGYLGTGAVGLRICPSFQNYRLTNRYLLQEFVNGCRDHNVTLFIMLGNTCCTSLYTMTKLEQVFGFATWATDINIVLQGLEYMDTAGLTPFLKANPSVHVETSMLYAACYVERLVEAGLAGQVCMGTAYGIQSPAAGLSIIRDADVDEESRSQMLYRNASALIGRK
jgi:predicted TIM-barrel fold metal-dependent hydrolase